MRVLWNFEFAILELQYHVLIRNDGLETSFPEIIGRVFFGDGQNKIASPSAKTFDDAVKVGKQAGQHAHVDVVPKRKVVGLGDVEDVRCVAVEDESNFVVD